MSSGQRKRSNVGVFFMLGAMFLVLGLVASRGFLAIGFTFLIIALASIGRPPMHLLDDLEERVDRQESENAGDREQRND
jgi:hypothetical protein